MSKLDKQIKALSYIINIIVFVLGFFCGVIYDRDFTVTTTNGTFVNQLATDNHLEDANLISWDEAYGTESEQDKKYFSIVPTATKQVSTDSPRIGKLVD